MRHQTDVTFSMISQMLPIFLITDYLISHCSETGKTDGSCDIVPQVDFFLQVQWPPHMFSTNAVNGPALEQLLYKRSLYVGNHVACNLPILASASPLYMTCRHFDVYLTNTIALQFVMDMCLQVQIKCLHALYVLHVYLLCNTSRHV